MRNTDNLPPSCAAVTKSGNLNFLEPSGPVQVCNGTALPLQVTKRMVVVVMMITIILIIIHHQGNHHHHLKCQKGSSTCEGKLKPGGLFRQNSIMCTPDKFNATHANIRALTECCFQPTMWQSQVYLGEEVIGPSLHHKH